MPTPPLPFTSTVDAMGNEDDKGTDAARADGKRPDDEHAGDMHTAAERPGSEHADGEKPEEIAPGRKPNGMRFETFVERQIRTAIERGDFDNLQGAGKPLRDDKPRDHGWWIKDYTAREGLSSEALLPPALRLRKERERLPGKAAECATAAEARQLAADFNRQVADHIRSGPVGPGAGPMIPVHTIDPDVLAEAWREAQAQKHAQEQKRDGQIGGQSDGQFDRRSDGQFDRQEPGKRQYSRSGRGKARAQRETSGGLGGRGYSVPGAGGSSMRRAARPSRPAGRADSPRTA